MSVETLADKLKRSAPGETQEDTNSLTGAAGLYRHPGSGAELITLHDPLLGDAQSEAAIRVGFKRVRDAKPEEVKVLAIASLDAESERAKVNDNSDAVKGITARLNALEAENAKLREQASKSPTSVEMSQAEGLREADEQTARRGTDNTPTSAGVGGVNSGTTPGAQDPSNTEPNEDGDEGDDEEEAKPLSQQNKTELLATAEAEGVEGVSEETKNDDLRKAIQAKRDETESEEDETPEDDGNDEGNK